MAINGKVVFLNFISSSLLRILFLTGVQSEERRARLRPCGASLSCATNEILDCYGTPKSGVVATAVGLEKQREI
jgi:hypothetical protein